MVEGARLESVYTGNRIEIEKFNFLQKEKEIRKKINGL